MPLPEKIANAPTLASGLGLFYGAFMDLATCRATGWRAGPIPWLAIDRYAEANGYEGEEREDLFLHVRAMDNAYLAWSRKEEGADHG